MYTRKDIFNKLTEFVKITNLSIATGYLEEDYPNITANESIEMIDICTEIENMLSDDTITDELLIQADNKLEVFFKKINQVMFQYAN